MNVANVLPGEKARYDFLTRPCFYFENIINTKEKAINDFERAVSFVGSSFKYENLMAIKGNLKFLSNNTFLYSNLY